MKQESSITAAVFMMVISMMLIPMGDTAGKLMATSYGVTPFFVAWSRFFLGALFMLPFLNWREFDFKIFLDWRILLRGSLIVATVSCILTAVKTESLATSFGAFFIGPILSYFLSAWLLKERITFGQTILLLIGFCGVLLVIKPGADISPGIGFALLSGMFYGGFLVANRWLTGIAPSRSLIFSQLAIGGIGLMPFGLAEIPVMSWELSGLTVLSALSSVGANILLIYAYRRAEASILAPIVYFQLISATLMGYLVFNNLPDMATFAGLGLLISSGLASLALRRRA